MPKFPQPYQRQAEYLLITPLTCSQLVLGANANAPLHNNNANNGGHSISIMNDAKSAFSNAA